MTDAEESKKWQMSNVEMRPLIFEIGWAELFLKKIKILLEDLIIMV